MPDGHRAHAAAPMALDVLGAHAAHVVPLPVPYVPPGQVRQAVDCPSTRYVPAPQHTPTPLARQRGVAHGPAHALTVAGYSIHSSMLR